jgi:hypothetical protein
LLDKASEFWRRKGLSIKKKTLEKTPEDVAMIAATLLAEEGTIRTIDFTVQKGGYSNHDRN